MVSPGLALRWTACDMLGLCPGSPFPLHCEARRLAGGMTVAKDMRTYIRQLEERRPEDLVTVRQEVDPRFGVTAIAQKLEEEGRFPVIFFERVKGSPIPLLINLTASYPRLAISMDSSIQEMVQQAARRETNAIPPRWVSDDEAPVKE